MKNKGLTIFGIVLIVIVILGFMFVNSYNSLQLMDENVNSKWAQVDNQLKRRNDLIPNLVATVKGYAAHESKVFNDVAQARAKLSGSLNANDVKSVQKNAGELSGALSRLLLVVERYPELKADKNFIALQDELSGTENRITVARMDYNESVKALNGKIRMFPTSIIASISGIKQRDYFEIDEADKQVPKVDFSN